MLPANSPQFKNKAGFTLIELLIVIAVIGILSGIIMVSFDGAKDKARIAKSLQFSNSVQNAIGVDMVGRWNFEKIEGGKVIDTSGYGNDGVVNGATLVSGLEQLGNALSFDGADDYVDCGSDASLNITDAITVEAWVKPSLGHTRMYSIVTKGDAFNLNEGYGLVINTDIRVWWYEKGASVSGSKIPDDVWSHIVAVRKGSEAKVWIYINGQIDQGFPKQVTSNDLTNVMSLKIGTCRYNYHYFDGLIDEVRTYSSALSSSAIRENYLAGLDKLLARGQITEDDYQQRIAELNSNYVARK